MLPLLILSLWVASVAPSVANVSCDSSKNIDSFCNAACTDPLKPYCFYGGTSQGAICMPSHPGLKSYIMCDCPANQTIQNWCLSCHNFGQCVPIPLLGMPCAGDRQCSVIIQGTTGSFYGLCVNGYCAACNASDPSLNASFTCPSGSPCPPCSRPGLVMRCNENGFWDVSGQIDTASEVGQVATTGSGGGGGGATSPSSSSSSSSSASPLLPRPSPLTLVLWSLSCAASLLVIGGGLLVGAGL